MSADTAPLAASADVVCAFVNDDLGARVIATLADAGVQLIALQCSLTPETHHLIDADAIARMKPGVMLINTSRGAVVDTRAIIHGLKTGVIGSLGLDVYEEEANLFFQDLSDTFIPDDVFARLLTFPNVLITGHQGFFTVEALTTIAQTTIENVSTFARNGVPLHPVSTQAVVGDSRSATPAS